MLRTQLSQCRQLLLIGLMVFTILGMQLLQASPLHDHTQHSVECTLCHFHLGDDTVVTKAPIFTSLTATAVLQPVPAYRVSNPTLLSHNNRGPPLISA